MKRISLWLGYVSAGIALFAFFLMLTVPAPWLGALLAHATDHQLALAQPRGTARRGQAIVHWRPARAQDQILGPIEWNWQLHYLLLGQLRFALRFEGEPLHGRATLGVGWQALDGHGIELEMPAATLTDRFPPLGAVALQGRLRFEAGRLRLTYDGAITGAAELFWQEATSPLLPGLTLGTYRLRLSGAGGQMRLELDTLNGALVLRGQGVAQLDGTYSFSGEALPEAEHEARLVPLLAAIGAIREQGRYVFRLPPALQGRAH